MAERCPTCRQPLPAGWTAPTVVQCARRSVEIGGVAVRPMHRDYLDDRPVVPFWRAVDRLGRLHDADTPEAAAKAAGARG